MGPLSFKPIPELKSLITYAVAKNKHNVIVIWGELGLGKTTLMLRLLLWCHLKFTLRLVDKHDRDVSGCRHENMCQHWSQVLKSLVDFTFWEMKDHIKSLVVKNTRLPALGWDDIAVYFHRSNIQYMHPEVKDFFSKYNFIRPYLANLFITTPDINFVPEQLLSFCTGDVWVTNVGHGDFDRSKLQRSFWGSKRSWTKHYDGYDVEWKACPPEVYKEYEEMRHAHAVEAFQKPEEIFVTTMPRAKEYTEEESLF